MGWREIGRKFPGVHPATLCAIYKHGREPKKSETRRALGLPVLQWVAVCPEHGIVHVGRCPRIRAKRKGTSYKRLWLGTWLALLATRKDRR